MLELYLLQQLSISSLNHKGAKYLGVFACCFLKVKCLNSQVNWAMMAFLM